MQLLDELVLPKDITIADVSQSIQEFEIERDALQEFFDDMLKTYTTYQEMKDYIESKMKELDEELIADQREVLRGLTKQFRREEIDYQVVMTKKPRFDDNGNFLGIEEKPEVLKLPTQNKDAIKAGELLGKRFGMWTDKVDMDIDVPTIISGADDLED